MAWTEHSDRLPREPNVLSAYGTTQFAFCISGTIFAWRERAELA